MNSVTKFGILPLGIKDGKEESTHFLRFHRETCVSWLSEAKIKHQLTTFHLQEGLGEISL